MTVRTQILTYFLLSVIVFSGCDKFRDNRNTDTTLDNALGTATFYDIFRVVDQYQNVGGGLFSDPCINVTRSGNSITIDFGSTSCQGLFGVFRSGSITAVSDAAYTDAGTVTTVTLNNTNIEGFEAAGTLTITNLGLTSGQQQYRLAVTDAQITVSDEEMVTWSCDVVFTLVEAGSLTTVLDDVFEVTGSMSGTNRDDRTFTVEITTNMVKEHICRWERAGIVDIKITDLKDRVVDYGPNNCEDGAECCDNEVEVEIGGRRDEVVNLN